MRRLVGSLTLVLVVGMGGLDMVVADEASRHGCCTDGEPCRACVPACKATWEENKAKEPRYSMRCEHACTRGFDPWHAPRPECRRCPPCGDPIVRKRLFKTDGPAEIERVPKYEVAMVPAEPCGCATCRRHEPEWWHPLRSLAWLLPW